MAKPKMHVKNLLDGRSCESKEDSCDYLAPVSKVSSATKSTTITEPFSEIEPKSIANGCGSISGNLLEKSPNNSAAVFQLFEDRKNTPQLTKDLDELSDAELNKRYKKEYNSWRNRRSVSKKAAIPFYPKWAESFRVFLRDVGPIPVEGYTLDKIVPELGYIPNNVRWASKETQTRNRPNTIWITIKGERLPLAAWALRTGQPESTLRYRLAHNWPHENIVSGISPHKSAAVPKNDWPWPAAHAVKLERAFQQETGGRGSRLRYLLYKASKVLNIISREVQFYVYPDWHNPSKDTEKELNILTKQYELWQSLWLHGKKLWELRGGEVSANSHFILSYR